MCFGAVSRSAHALCRHLSPQSTLKPLMLRVIIAAPHELSGDSSTKPSKADHIAAVVVRHATREHRQDAVPGLRYRCARLEMWAPSTQSRPCSRNWPPAPAIARQKLVGFIRPLATRLIERKPIRSCATPCIQERLDHSPTGLDPIRPLEQDRVPDHAIIDQRLVAGARCGVKIILVFKCH